MDSRAFCTQKLVQEHEEYGLLFMWKIEYRKNVLIAAHKVYHSSVLIVMYLVVLYCGTVMNE